MLQTWLSKSGSTPKKLTLIYVWFQYSAAKPIRYALFWVIKQCIVVIPCRRFGTTFFDTFTLEDETEGLSRNVGKKLPLYTV